MITKLQTIWKVITANYYLFMDGRGGWIGVTPKNVDQLKLMQELTTKLKDIQEKIK